MTNELRVDDALMPHLPELAPGVHGWRIDEDDITYLPVIVAARQGGGDVGRFLDSLDRSRTHVVPTVISPILEGMLERRGFHPEVRSFAELHDEQLVDCWVRDGADEAELLGE